MEVQDNLQNKLVPILCPMCGIQFSPTIGNICQACMVAKTDITIGITKEAVINFCRFCHRYLQPPWVYCQRDSKQLLKLLLKKIKGLNRSRLLNANFLWTQPHSKRLKVKLTIEKQLNNLTKIQQTFVTEFIQVHMQCDDCKKQFTPHTWGAVVQVRQRISHKKTFYYIQQLIIKNNAFDKVIKISEDDEGINFYYKNTTHAQRLITFLSTILPVTVKQSKQLISHDESSNVFSYKYTFSVQIPKICRDDLVVIPKKLAKQLGGCCRLLLCMKVHQSISLLDLDTFKYIPLSSVQYLHYDKDIQLLPLSRYKKQFVILDSEPIQKKKHQQIKSISNKYANRLFMYTITRQDDMENFDIKGSLGPIPCGQTVEGFDLKHLNYCEDVEDFKGVQEVVLVKRTKNRNRNHRAFKLKRLEEQGVIIQQKFKKTNKKIKEEPDDYEEFLDEVAEDQNLRKNIKLYKNQKVFDDKLKHKSKEQLEEILDGIEICELLDDMKIQDVKPNTYENDLEGIDEIIEKMGKITIEK